MTTIIIAAVVALILFLSARQLYSDRKKANHSAEENVHVAIMAVLAVKR